MYTVKENNVVGFSNVFSNLNGAREKRPSERKNTEFFLAYFINNANDLSRCESGVTVKWLLGTKSASFILGCLASDEGSSLGS
jgi:hypothetical protein